MNWLFIIVENETHLSPTPFHIIRALTPLSTLSSSGNDIDGVVENVAVEKSKGKAVDKVFDSIAPEKLKMLKGIYGNVSGAAGKALEVGNSSYSIAKSIFDNALKDIETYQALGDSPTGRTYLITDLFVKWGRVRWSNYDPGGNVGSREILGNFLN